MVVQVLREPQREAEVEQAEQPARQAEARVGLVLGLRGVVVAAREVGVGLVALGAAGADRAEEHHQHQLEARASRARSRSGEAGEEPDEGREERGVGRVGALDGHAVDHVVDHDLDRPGQHQERQQRDQQQRELARRSARGRAAGSATRAPGCGSVSQWPSSPRSSRRCLTPSASRRGPRRGNLPRLALDEAAVQPAVARQQLVVAAGFDDAALAEHQDLVGLADRREPVRDQEDQARPRPSAARLRSTRSSVSASSEAVGSSSTRIGASFSTARAIERRWRWPVESLVPRSPSGVS